MQTSDVLQNNKQEQSLEADKLEKESLCSPERIQRLHKMMQDDWDYLAKNWDKINP